MRIKDPEQFMTCAKIMRTLKELQELNITGIKHGKIIYFKFTQCQISNKTKVKKTAKECIHAKAKLDTGSDGNLLPIRIKKKCFFQIQT